MSIDVGRIEDMFMEKKINKSKLATCCLTQKNTLNLNIHKHLQIKFYFVILIIFYVNFIFKLFF
jgi:hypothetical protein